MNLGLRMDREACGRRRTPMLLLAFGIVSIQLSFESASRLHAADNVKADKNAKQATNAAQSPTAAKSAPERKPATASNRSPIDESIQTVRNVGRDGKGNAAAVQAVRKLEAADISALMPILKGFDGASPLAGNWLRGAAESLVARASSEKKNLPNAELEKFVADTKRDVRARRLAYELLLKSDPKTADRLLPGMLTDPSPEFRRDSVARLMELAKKIEQEGLKEVAVPVYERALTGAVDEDQVKAIVAALGKHGKKVDLQKHFGFLPQWSVIGPFDNRGLKGFTASYPPEKEIKLDATYDGQKGKVSWKPLATTNDFGILNIAKLLENYKGSVMYATAEFESATPRSVEIRLGTPNAWKLWVNGEPLFARGEYHRGMSLDQYRVPVQLKAGRNVILLKICQNEQKDDWAQRYEFQLRVCDSSGSAVRPVRKPDAKVSSR